METTVAYQQKDIASGEVDLQDLVIILTWLYLGIQYWIHKMTQTPFLTIVEVH